MKWLRQRRVLKWSLALLGTVVVGFVFLFLLNPAGTLYQVISIIGIPTKIEPLPPTSKSVQVRDDYFAIEYLDSQTIAIAEPRYWQKNVSYLLLGKRRALLFDSGPGICDISQLVLELTQLPITVTVSHLHYDHVGGLGKVGKVGLIDLPHLKQQIDADGFFMPKKAQHLGSFENIKLNRFKVDSWLSPDAQIDLGGRVVQIITTPGHTEDSVMLFDKHRRQLFAGDFIYPGYLVTLLPGAHMGGYLATSNRLLSILPEDVKIFPGHGALDGIEWQTPRLGYRDLADLRSTLIEIRDGKATSEMLFPRQFRVNSQISILSPFAWNMEWTE